MKMTFRWYGESDSIGLDYIRQIPCVEGVVTAVYSVPVGEVWPQEEIDGEKIAVGQKGGFTQIPVSGRQYLSADMSVEELIEILEKSILE